jgi:hypothetical protein
MLEDEFRDRLRRAEVELRQLRFHLRIAGHGNDVGVVRMQQRSQGDRRSICSVRPGSGAPRNSCISAQRRDEVTSTSVQPAWRWR